MKISCDFCGREAEVASTAEALREEGWYTHSVSTRVLTVSGDTVAVAAMPTLMGFVCSHCIAAPPRDIAHEAAHGGDRAP